MFAVRVHISAQEYCHLQGFVIKVTLFVCIMISSLVKQQRLSLAGGEMVEAAAPARAGQPERLLPTAVCKCAPDNAT